MTLADFPITDGFVFASKLRCGLTFRDIAIQEYELLRRATAMRNKMWLCPKDSSTPIPAFDSFEYAIYMKPGSVIWGYTFVATTGETTGTMSFQVRDACNDIPVFSEVITRQNVTPPYKQQYLSKLLVVGPPGLLNVTVCNTFATPMAPGQVVLYGGEPAL
jgi:hypothetical protein